MKKLIVNAFLVTGLLLGGFLIDFTGGSSSGEPIELSGTSPLSDKDLPPQHTPGGGDGN
ncbi:hypothetical protein [Alkalihalobacillus sp. CinArs1]|uniref:hypothetical protein n=1 Tax=Alkalihalobacillus sp. CinArs1 TaxID=2995314 RepID=UPI0022DE8113|nr:hypothetical protein [Alkalihalobacillus sp. CinArs1]